MTFCNMETNLSSFPCSVLTSQQDQMDENVSWTNLTVIIGSLQFSLLLFLTVSNKDAQSQHTSAKQAEKCPCELWTCRTPETDLSVPGSTKKLDELSSKLRTPRAERRSSASASTHFHVSPGSCQHRKLHRRSHRVRETLRTSWRSADEADCRYSYL